MYYSLKYVQMCSLCYFSMIFSLCWAEIWVLKAIIISYIAKACFIEERK